MNHSRLELALTPSFHFFVGLILLTYLISGNRFSPCPEAQQLFNRKPPSFAHYYIMLNCSSWTSDPTDLIYSLPRRSDPATCGGKYWVRKERASLYDHPHTRNLYIRFVEIPKSFLYFTYY